MLKHREEEPARTLQRKRGKNYLTGDPFPLLRAPKLSPILRGMKTFLLCLGFLLFSRSEISRAASTIEWIREVDTPAGWSALPRSRPFGILPSDPRDIRLGLRKNNHAELEADVGGYRSLVGWREQDAETPWIAHAGIEGAAYFQMRQEGSKFPLQSSDGLIGLYAEAARGPWAYQLRYTHISAHLSDGLFGVRTAILYTREFLVLRAAYDFGWFRPYVGYQVLTHTAPVVPRHTLQAGSYAILPTHWGAAHPYFGADLRVRNAAEGTTAQLSAGVALLSAAGALPVRVAANYLTGHDLRGQFYGDSLTKWSFGLEMDL